MDFSSYFTNSTVFMFGYTIDDQVDSETFVRLCLIKNRGICQGKDGIEYKFVAAISENQKTGFTAQVFIENLDTAKCAVFTEKTQSLEDSLTYIAFYKSQFDSFEFNILYSPEWNKLSDCRDWINEWKKS